MTDGRVPTDAEHARQMLGIRMRAENFANPTGHWRAISDYAAE